MPHTPPLAYAEDGVELSIAERLAAFRELQDAEWKYHREFHPQLLQRVGKRSISEYWDGLRQKEVHFAERNPARELKVIDTLTQEVTTLSVEDVKGSCLGWDSRVMTVPGEAWDGLVGEIPRKSQPLFLLPLAAPCCPPPAGRARDAGSWTDPAGPAE